MYVNEYHFFLFLVLTFFFAGLATWYSEKIKTQVEDYVFKYSFKWLLIVLTIASGVCWLGIFTVMFY